MYKFFRSLLFRLDPETAHHMTLQLMRIGGVRPINAILKMSYAAPSKPVETFGLTFKNSIGLAAGYDKDGIALRGLSALGFGHIEVGTVTLRPQPGNPKPRVFRLVEDEAVINRMGFPGRGADYVSRQLLAISGQRSVVLGLNLGKNKNTPLEEAADDYIALMQTFAPLADYLTINISSPNTVGLRRLQGRDMLVSSLKSCLDQTRSRSNRRRARRRYRCDPRQKHGWHHRYQYDYYPRRIAVKISGRNRWIKRQPAQGPE